MVSFYATFHSRQVTSLAIFSEIMFVLYRIMCLSAILKTITDANINNDVNVHAVMH